MWAQVPNGKPDPDLFLVCAERLGVDPRKCVGFEDGDLGMQAIRAAGMRGTVHIAVQR
jgi:HAD superfamily hydrolase (TIGR01509 family)